MTAPPELGGREAGRVERERRAAEYAAITLHELSEAKREIAMLQDIVVTYGDKLRMATVHRMDWQQAIDRAFEREPS